MTLLTAAWSPGLYMRDFAAFTSTRGVRGDLGADHSAGSSSQALSRQAVLVDGDVCHCIPGCQLHL